MSILTQQDTSADDAYLRPIFPFHDKLRRFLFNITWFLLCRWTPNPFHRWRRMILRLFGAQLGNKNSIYPTCRIWAPWLLRTDDVATIGPGVEIYNPGGVHLGHHAILSQNAYLCGATHDYNSKDFTYVKKEIVIGSYAWICAHAIVLPGVNCLEGSVLGAGSITSRNLEAWTVYRGNPAVPIKRRDNIAS